MSRTRGVPFQKKTVQRDVSTLQHFPHQWPYRVFLLGYFKFMYRNSYLPIACPPFSDWMKSRFPTSHDLRSSIHIHLAYVITLFLSSHSMVLPRVQITGKDSSTTARSRECHCLSCSQPQRRHKLESPVLSRSLVQFGAYLVSSVSIQPVTAPSE